MAATTNIAPNSEKSITMANITIPIYIGDQDSITGTRTYYEAFWVIL